MTACSVCHPTTPSSRVGGPHGMHPVDAVWAEGHDGYSRSSCQACHGVDYHGTEIAWSQGNRNYGAIGRQFWHGYEVGCYVCHAGPNGTDSGNANPPPTVANAAASTVAGQPVDITLTGSAFNSGPVSFRIVTQPVHGTVSLNGNVATFYPEATFVGADSFTYAAWDGSADSNLGTVALTTTPGACILSASALAPLAAFPNSQVPFRASASLSQCDSPITYDWDFGDGSAHGSGTNISHVYTNVADFAWTLKVAAGSAAQTIQGTVAISPTWGPPITLTIVDLGWALNISWPGDSIPTALESTTDLTQEYGWQPDVVDPVYFDGTNNNVLIFASSAQQLFRVRRLP